MTDAGLSPDVSLILVDQPNPAPILISDDSISRLEEQVLQQCDCVPSARLDETFLKCSHQDRTVRIQTPDRGLKEEGGERRGVFPARGGEKSQATSTLHGNSATNIKPEVEIKIEDKPSPKAQVSHVQRFLN